MASDIAGLGGYECDFVELPPAELLCLICTLVAREPMQVSCCGKVYCKACLTELKKHSRKCPNCRMEAIGFPDRRSERNIKALRVRCGNQHTGCGWVGELGSLIPTHRKTCPFENVACKYSTIGCEQKALRRELINDHEKDDQLHLHVAMETILKLETRQRTSEKQMLQAQARLSSLENRGTTNKMTFKMAKFSQCKESEDVFYSPPFYSHQGGYKMCVRVDANGNGSAKGTHVSATAILMRGENDDNLTWPFTGSVTVELLNQLADKEHLQAVITFPDAKKDGKYNSRVVDREMAMSGWGHHQFIPHADLGHDPATARLLLKDDCLYFRVSVKATTLNPKPWLTCTL